MNNCFIYVIKHPITKEIRYVGQSSVGKKRFKTHVEIAKCKNKTPVQKFINKYIALNLIPIFEEIEYCESADLNHREIHWIDFYKKHEYKLLNLTIGGEGAKGRVLSQETKDKISNSNKGKIISDNIKKHLSEINMGKIPWNKGLEASNDSKKRMSEAQKGKVISKETIIKIKETWNNKLNNGFIHKPSEKALIALKQYRDINGYKSWSKGKKFTELHKSNLSLNSARKGNPGTRLGKKASSELRAKLSISQKKVNRTGFGMKIICNDVIYYSANDASRKTGISASNILIGCRENRPIKNLIFKFI